MSRHAWILVMLCACGEPILKNAPRPDPGAVAGVAAAAAAAATLAAPDAAARRQEQKKEGEPERHSIEVKETVPASVFDRIDHSGRDAGVDGTAASPPAGSTPAGSTPAGSPPAGSPPAGSPPKMPRLVPPPVPPSPTP